ncbi:MAG: cytochrome c oxidase subunit II [Alphaproteobacteria bacterium RIFCSPHIGHO2_12_FULL_45_9]|nr:MAG: cytochrome c oxidase subunit II [Alphaproteobacteria bacterium RIFCSPHIGHO2_02_FULL_46_13]OFW95951.1 MAG: cytochrome c oxidase subunit II [Alphaproteobacteria bacterium RIFCSPHIGHO2_12_FULL_45_9]
MIKNLFLPLFAFLAVFTLSLTNPAFAEIVPWQMDFQDAVTPAMEHINSFHNMLLYIISGIVAFVTILLVYVLIRFNAKANPVPSTTTHNVLLEVIWTVVPVVILIVIAVPSFKLLFFEARNPEPELTVKVTGYQWYWGYEYPENGDIAITSNMLAEKEVDKSKGQTYLLSADNPMVIPVDTNVMFQVTASDVIHSFAMPQFGIKVDAVPGRLNSAWARVTKVGTYYGQCSELCGKNHGFMPIEIKVVSKEDFAAWIKKQGGHLKETPAATEAKAEVKEEIQSAAPIEAKDVATEIKTNK